MTGFPYARGDLVAGYRIGRVIALGGVGVVYEAIHEYTERRVALKLLRPDCAGSAEATERARKEAIALCRLQHRNIVSVHDAGQLPSGAVYMAMELLRGVSLREVFEREAPLELSRALHIAAEVADALAAAHELGIVHRDVKPENVHLGAGDAVKLLDLNIAHIAIDGIATTKPGRQLGTTAYAAPEQFMGQWSAASDVYDLCIVLYEGLAGRHPFAKKRGLAGLPTEAELTAAHLWTNPAPIHQVEPSVPDYVWPVLRKGLAKMEERRYRHAGELAVALRALSGRYLADVEAGRIVPARRPDLRQAGAWREHHAPQEPERTPAAAMVAEPRVVLAAAAAASAVDDGASGRLTAPGAPSPVEAREAECAEAVARPRRTATPSPVAVPSAIRRGWSVAARAVATLPILNTGRRRLLRRCVAAAALAIPVSAAAMALYLQARGATSAIPERSAPPRAEVFSARIPRTSRPASVVVAEGGTATDPPTAEPIGSAAPPGRSAAPKPKPRAPARPKATAAAPSALAPPAPSDSATAPPRLEDIGPAPPDAPKQPGPPRPF